MSDNISFVTLQMETLRDARLLRLQTGQGFGCAGRHRCSEIPGLHHHHDAFCKQPTNEELATLGMTRGEWAATTRGRD